MTKQDYLIERALCHEVTVIPNKRMQCYMEEGMLFVYKELRRIEVGGDIPEELANPACILRASSPNSVARSMRSPGKARPT